MFDFTCLQNGSVVTEYISSDRHCLTKQDSGICFKDTYDVLIYIMEGSCYVGNAKTKLTVQTGDILYIPCDNDSLVEFSGREKCELCAVYFVCYERKRDIAVKKALFDDIIIQRGSKKGSQGVFPLLFSRICEKKEPLYAEKLRKTSLFFLLIDELAFWSEHSTDGDHYEEISFGIAYIENNFLDEFSIEEVARKCGVCVSNFYKLFKKRTGLTPVEYKNMLKVKRAMELLKSHDYSIEEISSMLNFCNQSFFIRTFKKFTGHTPRDFVSDIK